MKILQLIFMLMLIPLACTEPYNFEAISTIKTIVVDASLTNESKAHYVRITYTYPIDEFEKPPVTNAIVWIEDNDGNSVELTERESGYYYTDSSFAGVVGKSYSLHFTTRDGKQYASSEEVMQAPVPIDSIYAEYFELPSSENGSYLRGVQVFIDSRRGSNQANSFRYEYEETYQIKVNDAPKFMLLPGDTTPVERNPSLEICYKSKKSSELILGSTLGLTENRITRLPIRYVSDRDQELVSGYALIVKQYAISPEAYYYYQKLKESNQFAGSFFDKQKGSIYGNISSLDDEAVPVLGYFEVASVSGNFSRVFRPEEYVPEGFRIPQIFKGCQDPIKDVVTLPGVGILIDSVVLKDGVIYDTIKSNIFGLNPDAQTDTIDITDFNFETNEIVYIHSSCGDCRLHGKFDKPYYWE